MATPPLFVSSLAVLKEKLRLSGLPTGKDGEAILNEGILAAREKFHRRLGASRVTTLLALVFTETPTTHDEVLRSIANTTEVLLVRRELLCTLPVAFVDGNKPLTIFGTEAPFRHLGPSDLQIVKGKLDCEIEENLQILEGSDSIGGEERGLQVAVIEPEAVVGPFHSVRI